MSALQLRPQTHPKVSRCKAASLMASRNGLVMSQTQPGKGVLARESPAHRCPLPAPPPPHPASAEGGDTLGRQRSAGSGLSLSRQANGQHSTPVLGRPGVWSAQRALWVCPAPEPSVAPQFLSTGRIHAGVGGAERRPHSMLTCWGTSGRLLKRSQVRLRVSQGFC